MRYNLDKRLEKELISVAKKNNIEDTISKTLQAEIERDGVLIYEKI